MQVTIAGGSVEVDDHGQGTAVLLVHGFPLSSEIWGPIRPSLSAEARSVTPDLLGFGRSDKPVRTLSIDDLADDVIAVADALGIEQFVLGGHSMGGYVALSVAERWRERLLGLALVDTRAEADDEAGRERRDEAVRLLRDGGRAEFLDSFVPNLVGETTKQRGGRLLADLRAIAEEIPDHVLVACLEAMRDRPDRRGLLDGFDLPVLVVVGEEDGVTPPAQARAMVERLPHGILSVVPGAGHTPSVERPIAFADTLAGFVAGIQAT